MHWIFIFVEFSVLANELSKLRLGMKHSKCSIFLDETCASTNCCCVLSLTYFMLTCLNIYHVEYGGDFSWGGEEKTVWLWTLLSLAITFITFALSNLVLSFDTLIGRIFKSFGFFFHGIPYMFTSTHRVVLWSWISKFCPENFSLCVVNTSNLINLTARRILIKLFYFYIIL